MGRSHFGRDTTTDEVLEGIDALVPPCSVAIRCYDEAAGADFRAHSNRSVV
jgi:hypothetical protein